MFLRVFLLVLLFPALTQAQFIRDHTSEKNLRSFHNVDGVSQIRRSFQSTAEARQQFEQILSAVGLNTIGDRIILRASADTNAAVAIFNKESLERFIFYNARFMQKLNQQAGEYWSLLFVLAHELGHHLAFHNEVQGRFHEFELEADKFAGFILRRMGATLEQTEAAVIAVVPEEASETHPGQADRLQAIALGWAEGGGQGAPQIATPPGGQQLETSIPTTDISYWHHNGSLMKLFRSGDNVEIHYQEPSRKMTTAVNRLGSLLFSGLLSGSSIKGTAYVYSSRCNQKYAYSVTGQIDKNRIVLSGPAPDLNGCFHRGNVWNSNSELLFTN